jgi:hypothetical protein
MHLQRALRISRGIALQIAAHIGKSRKILRRMTAFCAVSSARLSPARRECGVAAIMPQLQKPLAPGCAISYPMAAEIRNFITRKVRNR